MMLLAITFRLLDAIKLFDTIFIMTGGGPGTSTYTASFYLYTVGFTQFHLSQATAGSWIFLILTAIVDHVPGAPAASTRSRPDGQQPQPVRRAPTPALRSAAILFSASSCSSCWCRSTGCSSPRSSRATTIWPCRRSGSRPQPTLVHYTAALFAYRGPARA